MLGYKTFLLRSIVDCHKNNMWLKCDLRGKKAAVFIESWPSVHDEADHQQQSPLDEPQAQSRTLNETIQQLENKV